MNSIDLKNIAVRLSGRPSRKNKQGIGAYKWLADKLNVHQTTIWRWMHDKEEGGCNIPQWAVEEIEKLTVEHDAAVRRATENETIQ